MAGESESPNPTLTGRNWQRALGLRALWRGESGDDYGLEAVQATCAAGLLALGRASDWDSARTSADQLWQARDKEALTDAT